MNPPDIDHADMVLPPDAPGDAWARRALGVHFSRHPVDATFVGLHQHDHRLPEVDGEGVLETVSSMRGLLEGLDRAADAERTAASPGLEAATDGQANPDGREARAGADPFHELDRLLLRGFLKTRIHEYESGHVSSNPSVHVGDAVFGLMGPLLSDYAPFEERWAAVEARMAELPAFLYGVREVLGPTSVRGGPVPAAWARRAIRECGAGVRFLEEGLDRLLSTDAETRRTRAAEAFRAFAHFLEAEVVPPAGARSDAESLGAADGMTAGPDGMTADPDGVACGPEAFDLYLREGHFLDRSADEIVAYARDEMLRTRSWLESAAADFDASTPDEVVAGLADDHPTARGYLSRYREIWEEMRATALERELVTWPDVPIEYVERPEWARAAAPDLYFLFYRSPAAFGRPDVHRYMVAPLDPDLIPEEREAFLRSNNDAVIKMNHVVHHGGIGHHVQNWHAFRSPSLVGRVAAVDCASRIAMFCGGTMAEGWACYATDLIAEAGGLTERERYAEHRGRVRICARAIVDVELHHGRMSLDEAAAFYRDATGMSETAAEAEAVKNSMFPGAALMYLVGTDMIHELRSDLMRSLGDDFTLRAFHDAFLSYGSVPVRLIADEMRRRAGLGLDLDAHAELPAGYRASWSEIAPGATGAADRGSHPRNAR